jgi:hypothetical protein
VDRRVKLTLTGASSLSARFARPGRCVYPASATDLQHEHSADRSILESPPPSAFAGDDSFHAAEHDRVELRLTASFQLQHGWHDRPRFPGELSLLGPAGP